MCQDRIPEDRGARLATSQIRQGPGLLRQPARQCPAGGQAGVCTRHIGRIRPFCLIAPVIGEAEGRVIDVGQTVFNPPHSMLLAVMRPINSQIGV